MEHEGVQDDEETDEEVGTAEASTVDGAKQMLVAQITKAELKNLAATMQDGAAMKQGFLGSLWILGT